MPVKRQPRWLGASPSSRMRALRARASRYACMFASRMPGVARRGARSRSSWSRHGLKTRCGSRGPAARMSRKRETAAMAKSYRTPLALLLDRAFLLRLGEQLATRRVLAPAGVGERERGERRVDRAQRDRRGTTRHQRAGLRAHLRMAHRTREVDRRAQRERRRLLRVGLRLEVERLLAK